jgi:hypothetical protein
MGETLFFRFKNKMQKIHPTKKKKKKKKKKHQFMLKTTN